jgi:hypothetical protein
MKADPRVDSYIAKAAPFARPLLSEMRKRIHKACPDATETIKWNVPFYVLGGKLLASMAAFKQHTKFGVWREMQPTFVDVKTAGELPAAAAYAAQLKSAAELSRGGAVKPVAKKKAPAKKKARAKK